MSPASSSEELPLAEVKPQEQQQQGPVQISTDWWMAIQPQTGFPYYYNSTTKELSWSPPMFGVGGDGKQVQMGGGGGAGATMGSASGLGQREVEVRGSGNIP